MDTLHGFFVSEFLINFNVSTSDFPRPTQNLVTLRSSMWCQHFLTFLPKRLTQLEALKQQSSNFTEMTSRRYHTCHISYCEIKSHRIWPIWKPIPISQNFQTILQHMLWRNKHTSYFVVFITNFTHYDKGFWLFWGSLKVIFVKISQNVIKSHLKICLISQISVHSLSVMSAYRVFTTF